MLVAGDGRQRSRRPDRFSLAGEETAHGYNKTFIGKTEAELLFFDGFSCVSRHREF